MDNLMDIHAILQEHLSHRFTLEPVKLKHPLPERPLRTLGLMKINGEVFSTDKLMRIVFLRPELPVYFAVRSMFIRPRIELDLPVFAGEVMRTGTKKMVIVDIHRTGKTHHDDSELFKQMLAIRNNYGELNAFAIQQKGQIQEVFSKAACQVKISDGLDEQAIGIFKDYLNLYCDMVDKATPVAGEEREKTQRVFEDYLTTLVDHDPGVGVWKMLFGKKGGVERSMDMHFGR
jgi:hypothetical protein